MMINPTGQPFLHKVKLRKVYGLVFYPSKAKSCKIHGVVRYWVLERSLGIPSEKSVTAI